MPHVCVSIKSKCLFIIERKIACHSAIYNNFSKKSHNYYLTTDISIKLHINVNKSEENQKTIQKPVKPPFKMYFCTIIPTNSNCRYPSMYKHMQIKMIK